MDLSNNTFGILYGKELLNDTTKEVDLFDDPSIDDNDDGSDAGLKLQLDSASDTADESPWTKVPYSSQTSAMREPRDTPRHSRVVIIAVLALVSFTIGIIISIQAHSYPVEAREKGSRFLGHVFIFGIFELVVFLATPWLSRYFKLDFLRIGFIYAGNILVIVVANPIWAITCKKLNKTRIPSIIAAMFIVVSFALQGPAPFLPLHLTLPICIVAVILQGIGIGGEVVCSCMGGVKEARNNGYPDNVETKNLLFALGCAGYTIGVFVGSSVGILMVNTVGYPMASLFIIIQQTLVVILNIFYSCISGNMEQSMPPVENEPLIEEAEAEQ